jgi:peptide/nickel transport system substrate-binding protein
VAHLGGGGFLPKHYLSQFHPKYTSVDAANKLAADAGFKGWPQLFRDKAGWHRNPELPVVTPWVVTRPISNPPWEFAANPYSIWVDSEGNQLPYIGKITMTAVENIEVVSLRASSGEFDVQERHLSVGNLPVLLENQKRGGYTIHRAPYGEIDCGIRINLAYDEDKELGELFRTVEFRRALSLGIDRAQINEAFFVGAGVPTATICAEGSIYDPGPEWHTKWATHDPAQANALLDGIGLTAKDGEGYRLRKDGKGRIRLEFITEGAGGSSGDFVGVTEMVKGQWKQIGIDLVILTLEGNLSLERALANKLQFLTAQLGTDDPFLKGDTFLPTVTNNSPGMIGIPYAQWFASGGKQGKEPPESLRLLTEAMSLYQKGLTEPNDAERARIGKELYKMHADQVWSIGVVGFSLASYGIYLTSNKLRNVPARVVNSLQMKSNNNTYPMTFYYE